jgi:hypothetical protein
MPLLGFGIWRLVGQGAVKRGRLGGAARHGKQPSQVALRWHIQQGVAVSRSRPSGTPSRPTPTCCCPVVQSQLSLTRSRVGRPRESRSVTVPDATSESTGPRSLPGVGRGCAWLEVENIDTLGWNQEQSSVLGLDGDGTEHLASWDPVAGGQAPGCSDEDHRAALRRR